LQALKGRRLDADDFDKLSVEDPVRDMLRWLDNPQGFETAAKGSRWESFRALSRSEFGIYPDQTSPSEIAALLLRSDPKLDRIWSRFSEAPQLYPGVAKRLRDPMSVGQGMLAPSMTTDAKNRLLTLRLLDDWAYQANIRADIAIRQENYYQEYQIALSSGTASAAQKLAVKINNAGNGVDHQIVTLEARGDNITFLFGGSGVTASNTVTSNALVAGNFSIPKGAIMSLDINGNFQNYVSVQADTGGAGVLAIIRLATFN